MTQAEPRRRDVLRIATGVAGAVGVVGAVAAAAFMVSRLDQTDADIRRPDRGRRGRCRSCAAAARSADHGVLALVAGPRGYAASPQAPATLQAPAAARPAVRSRVQGAATAALCGQLAAHPSSGRSTALVGVCTHMGCLPQFYPQPARVSRSPIGSADISVLATARNTILPAAYLGGDVPALLQLAGAAPSFRRRQDHPRSARTRPASNSISARSCRFRKSSARREDVPPRRRRNASALCVWRAAAARGPPSAVPTCAGDLIPDSAVPARPAWAIRN